MCCMAAGSPGGCDSKSFTSNDTSEVISALEFLSEGQLSRFNPHSKALLVNLSWQLCLRMGRDTSIRVSSLIQSFYVHNKNTNILKGF